MYLETLVKADLLRIISRGFSYPSEENLNEIRGISSEITAVEIQTPWTNLLSEMKKNLDASAIKSEYSRLFLMKQVPLNESNCCARLNAVTDVAGFYKAFGMNPKSGDAPDALPYELEFLALLLVKYCLAQSAEQMEITLNAYDKFMNEHLKDFSKKFSEKMHAAQCSGFYIKLLELLELVSDS